jgi:cob(I)alamin adenosyltransferase
MSGCVQIYTGDGKGKTTAATGLAVRAVGAGRRVFIGQFIKAKDSHEMALLRERCPEVTVEQFGQGRFIRGNPTPDDIAMARQGIERLREVLTGGVYDVVVADEANGALGAGVIELDALLGLLDVRPSDVELVITGRNAPQELVDRADLVTEMRKVKHGFDTGIPAREGIEY